MKQPHARRTARVGLVLLFAMFAATLAACIFDQGDYKGGGRVPSLTATVENEAGPTGTDTTSGGIGDSGGIPDTGLFDGL